MNYIDLIIALFLAWFAYKGYSKGLVIELASLAALVLGIYAALYFSDITADFLVTYLKVGKKYLSLIAFVLTFILVVIGVITVGRVLEKFIDILLLGFLNKLTGAVFGVLKGMLILSLLIMLLNYIGVGSLIDAKTRESSLFYETIKGLAPLLYEQLDFLKDVEVDLPKVA
ncbi:MAG: CvpA family protein [Bacteroidetes bacterium]|nr:CvpA family protein [Bacteroidota bacterium]MBU1577971.1 CvpA family protein [Bacteroidota bacterium]MBU2466283.1 CvpA family protein [Bacteroidota bacterium]